jgi:protein-L-isoaspartate(D-aspartate) O-methyltransferase
MRAHRDAGEVGASTRAARNRMVDLQLVRRGIRDRDLLKAMRKVPREVFVEKGLAAFAYEDAPLRIPEGQTISQPYIVAAMIEAADLGRDDRVLEVGAGSGYAAAVMSRIVSRVYAIERHEALTKAAASRFKKLGYGNVELKTGDGTKGWPDTAPFDAILVAASSPEVPEALCDQLVVGGRLIIPIGDREQGQMLRRIFRRTATSYEEEDLGAVTFVPLIGDSSP